MRTSHANSASLSQSHKHEPSPNGKPLDLIEFRAPPESTQILAQIELPKCFAPECKLWIAAAKSEWFKSQQTLLYEPPFIISRKFWPLSGRDTNVGSIAIHKSNPLSRPSPRAQITPEFNFNRVLINLLGQRQAVSHPKNMFPERETEKFSKAPVECRICHSGASHSDFGVYLSAKSSFDFWNEYYSSNNQILAFSIRF